jgi:tRNA-uridine 2-sulfurtransferase
VKFRLLPQRLREAGITFDYFATGHYVRSSWDERRQCWTLRRASDGSKDQSYFLYFLDQQLLGQCLFPLGGLRKPEVRQLAARYGLPVAEKAESQDFMSGGHRPLLAGAAQPGPILDRSGRELGRHPGIVFYTVGQRRGLGLAGAEPLYVIAKDERRQALIVGGRSDLLRGEMTVGGMRWIMPGTPPAPFSARVKIRHGAPTVAAVCLPLGPDRLTVRFREAQVGVAPGQSAVFYNGDEVLGGGIIEP